MNRLTIALIASLTLLSGCATKTLKTFERDQQGHLASATDDRAGIANLQEGYLRRIDEVWVGDRSVTPATVGVEVMPDSIAQRQVSFRRQYPVTLQLVAEWISTHARVPVTVTADAASHAGETVVDPVAQLVGREGTSRQNRAAAAPAAGSAAAAPGDGAFYIQYDGSLRGLLDEVAARTGNSWAWRNGRAVLMHVDTRSFQIHAIPGRSTVEATVSNMTSAGGQSAGGDASSRMTQTSNESGQTTSVRTEIETFDTIAKSIEAMLSPKGKVFAAPATGTVSVTDVPAVLDRVGAFVRDLNQQMTRQVVVDVRVYAVDMEQNESYGIDWRLVWENVSSKYRLVTDLSAGPVDPDASSLNLSVIDNGSQFGGSQALLRALSAQGNVSIKSSAAVVTLSNQPAPVQIAEETTYLAESTTQLVANAGAAVSLTQGKVVTGFSMNVLPVVLDSNDVLLQLQMNLSTLRGLREIASGDQRIEAPQIDARQFLQRVKLQSGSTLVLSGFEQDRINTDAKGIGKPTFTLAGGSRNGSRKNTVLVVTLTPKVLG